MEGARAVKGRGTGTGRGRGTGGGGGAGLQPAEPRRRRRQWWEDAPPQPWLVLERLTVRCCIETGKCSRSGARRQVAPTRVPARAVTMALWVPRPGGGVGQGGAVGPLYAVCASGRRPHRARLPLRQWRTPASRFRDPTNAGGARCRLVGDAPPAQTLPSARRPVPLARHTTRDVRHATAAQSSTAGARATRAGRCGVRSGQPQPQGTRPMLDLGRSREATFQSTTIDTRERGWLHSTARGQQCRVTLFALFLLPTIKVWLAWISQCGVPRRHVSIFLAPPSAGGRRVPPRGARRPTWPTGADAVNTAHPPRGPAVEFNTRRSTAAATRRPHRAGAAPRPFPPPAPFLIPATMTTCLPGPQSVAPVSLASTAGSHLTSKPRWEPRIGALRVIMARPLFCHARVPGTAAGRAAVFQTITLHTLEPSLFLPALDSFLPPPPTFARLCWPAAT